jgi:two-component system phosphate regulon sensor histidine kinase PhoR
VRSRIFAKLLLLSLLVIAVVTAVMELAIPHIQPTTGALRRTILWSSGVALLAALGLSAIAAQSLAKRLRRIEEFAKRMAAGDLAARIAESSSDEIGKLAAALDTTAGRLEANFKDIQTSRQQLETVLNSMQEGVIAVSADRRVRWANRLMDRRIPGGVRLGAPLVETIRDPDFLRAIEEALATGVVRTARATSILTGHSYYITATPMPGSGAVAVLHDVTEIERVEKTRRDFIANVSHELRTPLTSIQGYAETLLDSMRNGAEREFLEIIRKNAARMSRLTEDLLTLARVESGETSFTLQPVAPADLLHDAEQDFREICKTRAVELVVEAQSTGPVTADRDAIHQVLANLLDNAVKYGAAGGKIVVGARDAHHAVEFYVRDFGAGIASEHLSRLFERFYRVDKARSVESGGTGLGLAIAKHIVRAHGGSIRAESALGHGATFIFTLPLAASAALSTHASQ